jgi:Uncharacterised nucleotidyltransferase
VSVARQLFQILGSGGPAPDHGADPWQQILAFADRTHLTLHLRGIRGLPQWVEQQIEERYSKNAKKRQRLEGQFHEIHCGLTSREIPYVLLKGFTHETGFGLKPGSRAQGDLDFLVSPEDKPQASKLLEAFGYRPHGRANLSAEHDRPWVRPFTWSWRGDYFDSDMPIPVELHDSVWNQARDRIQCPGLEEFWARRTVMEIAGMQVPTLQEEDRITFAALHALRHILRNDARPAHVYELCGAGLRPARNSIRQAGDLAHLQSIAFRFAQEWFGSPVPEEFETLPASVRSWFKNFAWSPVENLTRPNKDVLWLHLALVQSRTDRWRVAANRLLPLRLPHERLDTRLKYHASALLPALHEGARWWWRRTASSTASHTSD